MKRNRILTSLALALSMIVVSGTTVFATDTHIELNNLDSISNENITGTTSLDSSSTVVSDVLTFNEMVSEFAKDNNISEEQATLQIESNFINTIDTTTRTSRSQTILDARAATYRTLSSTINVTSSYKPSIRFYCQTDEWPGSSFRAIDRLLTVTVNGSYGSLSKGFIGSGLVQLETANRISWTIKGNFVNIGTGGSYSVNLTPGQSANYSISGGSSGVYKSVSTNGTTNF
ncbi:hypothetical protein [Clostridium culturomicium]|uniref:hypothetical protein n=1 Tax=Clostridium culturomicium TaxID=1499683 RepID=UPI000693734D|nr:hypothetical protein [Clostridium culturomicium]